ncbi:MAG: NYN domain-containing protein [Candidatus Woesebacteria bacterium]
MFKAKTERLKKLAQIYPDRIKELEKIFDKPTNIYLDWANMLHWSEKLSWHIDPKRLKQFCDSFSAISVVRLYQGTLETNPDSIHFINDLTKMNYAVTTKAVKIMRLPIDVSGIPNNSPAILANFIKKPLLRRFTLETIEFLNDKLKDLNLSGITYIEHRKCNFDVELGRDMLHDYDAGGTDNFILWSGDSDFADPVSQLLKDKKKVVIFATARRISIELGATKAQIFDIQKIRNFICNAKEIQPDISKQL